MHKNKRVTFNTRNLCTEYTLPPDEDRTSIWETIGRDSARFKIRIQSTETTLQTCLLNKLKRQMELFNQTHIECVCTEARASVWRQPETHTINSDTVIRENIERSSK